MIRPYLKIKEDVRFQAAHFRPHVSIMLVVALDTAPLTTDGAVWVTQAYRKIRETLDFHELMAAFDFRCRNIEASDQAAKEIAGHLWAGRIQAELGDDYDVVAHGVGGGFHVHSEYDPRG